MDAGTIDTGTGRIDFGLLILSVGGRPGIDTRIGGGGSGKAAAGEGRGDDIAYRYLSSESVACMHCVAHAAPSLPAMVDCDPASAGGDPAPQITITQHTMHCVAHKQVQ